VPRTAKTTFHPDLRVGRFLPPLSFGPRVTRVLRRARPRPVPSDPAVAVEPLVVDGPPGAPPVHARVFRPSATGPSEALPLLLWVHGGGLVSGSPEQDDRANTALARDLGITVAAVRYRLAPDHRGPAAVEDAYAVLRGLHARADEVGVDRSRIAVGGASAGGGIAAALTQLALDRGEVPVAFQLLVYPMLDDRTVTRRDHDTRGVRVWTPRSNRFGWTSYLGREPGGATVPDYVVPARREDLRGLPPAWIGVGDLDLFHHEDLEYAERLRAAGVPCEVHVVPGAFHGFDALFRGKPVSREFFERQRDALAAAFA
jgi:acetyl esterase/lipase